MRSTHVRAASDIQPVTSQNARVILDERPRKDRHVMRDPIAQLPQRAERLMDLDARQRPAVRKRAAKRQPERQLVVRAAASLALAICSRAPTSSPAAGVSSTFASTMALVLHGPADHSPAAALDPNW